MARVDLNVDNRSNDVTIMRIRRCAGQSPHHVRLPDHRAQQKEVDNLADSEESEGQQPQNPGPSSAGIKPVQAANQEKTTTPKNECNDTRFHFALPNPLTTIAEPVDFKSALSHSCRGKVKGKSIGGSRSPHTYNRYKGFLVLNLGFEGAEEATQGHQNPRGTRSGSAGEAIARR